MQYCWNIEKIRKQRHQIQSLLRNRVYSSKEEKEELKIEIKTLTDMEKEIEDNHLYYHHSISRIKYADPKKFLPIYTLQEYCMIPYDLRNVIISSATCFQNFIDNHSDIELPHIELSNQELVEISDDFYQSLPNQKYLKYFRMFTNPENHLLRFINGSDNDYFGLTRLFYYPNYRAYFSIGREHTIEDFETLNHEIAHGICFQKDNYKTLNSKHYYLTELEGHFFNYLSRKYLVGKVDNTVINQMNYYYFITYFNQIVELYLIDYATFLAMTNRNISIPTIKKKILRDEFPIFIDESRLLTAFHENPKVNTLYTLSYLIDLDLESIYEQDPEYSFYLFERIRKNKTNDIFRNLRENKITFMDDGYQNLQKKIKSFGEIKL